MGVQRTGKYAGFQIKQHKVGKHLLFQFAICLGDFNQIYYMYLDYVRSIVQLAIAIRSNFLLQLRSNLYIFTLHVD